MTARIYLDNAATSWPKPDGVYEAVDRFQRENGSPYGRSAYRNATETARLVEQTRRRVAQLFNAESASRIIFALNGTDALNLAIHGLLRAGDHVVTSVVEHNSVLRPLRELEKHGGIEVTRLPCDGKGTVDPVRFEHAIRPNTRLFSVVHASNVTGTLQPVCEISQVAQRHGIFLLVDAAQSLGHVPVDVQRLGADFVAAPGHKGMLGPLGTGLLYVKPGVESQLRSARQGGTGTESELDEQPDALPEKYESGNLNVPGIVGLGAAVEFLGRRGISDVREREQNLTARLLDGFDGVEGVRVFGPSKATDRVGVVSIRVSGYDPHEVAAMLEASAGIEVRAGLHCAPRIHESLGTKDLGGTVRFSVGPFNSDEQVDRAIAATAELASTSSVC